MLLGELVVGFLLPVVVASEPQCAEFRETIECVGWKRLESIELEVQELQLGQLRR